MHLDDIVPNVTGGSQENTLPVGCSTIICNQSGHVRMNKSNYVCDLSIL